MNNNLYNNGYLPNQAFSQGLSGYQGNMQGGIQGNYQTNIRENYVEEYLRNNLGKRVEAHVSFSDSIEWRDSVFTGILEDVGRDYVVIRNNQNSYIIWSVYINYIVLTDNYREKK